MVIKALAYLSKAVSVALLSTSLSLPVFASTVDSDGDGVADVVENRYGLDPHKPYDVWRDDDGDHLPNILEYMVGLDANTKDNDVYNDKRLLAMGAYVDLRSSIASELELERLLQSADTPVALYIRLLDEAHLARMGFIGRAYQAVFNRSPDLDGARYYYHMLGSGMSKLQMMMQFVGSKEFERAYGELDNEAFIALAHLNIVNRAPSIEEMDYFQDLMNSQGLNRGALILAFVESQEFINALDANKRIEMLSLLLTGEVPDKERNQRFCQWIVAEGHIGSVLRTMLSSDGFRQSRMNLNATLDSDGDGANDGVEFIDGTDIRGKDNDVMSSDRAFVRQMLSDINADEYTYVEIESQLTALKKASSRASWLLNVMAQNDIHEQQHIAQLLLGRPPQSNEIIARENNLVFIDSLLNSAPFQARFY